MPVLLIQTLSPGPSCNGEAPASPSLRNGVSDILGISPILFWFSVAARTELVAVTRVTRKVLLTADGVSWYELPLIFAGISSASPGTRFMGCSVARSRRNRSTSSRRVSAAGRVRLAIAVVGGCASMNRYQATRLPYASSHDSD
jgi:hypothetical protein